MTTKIVIKKLTASEISSSIIYPLSFNPFPSSILTKAIQRGKIAHSRNGYTNSKLYSRFYKGIEIVGIPDRVESDWVYEFKTYSSLQAKARNEKVGTIQILVYEFLTNLPGKLVMYDIHQDVITDIFQIPFDKRKFNQIITNAVRLKKAKLRFINDYKILQKKARDQLFSKNR